MKIPLSARLRACCAYILPGDRVADIGCDHGYLGIHLLSHNISKSVIAADINPMPLESAMRNAVKFGVRDRMTFCLSDGAQAIPREFDVMVCAGMGADTIISVLTAAVWLQSEQYRLILQCQSKTPILRQYLNKQGWHIRNETVLRDGRFLYTVMDVIWQPGQVLSAGECYFPSVLTKNEHLSDYYVQVIKGLENIVLNQKENANPFAVQALEELCRKELL